MDIEDKTRIIALKEAAITMNILADTVNDDDAKSKAKSLAWVILWAIKKLEELL